MKAKRAYLTDREAVEMWSAQRGLCGCGCGETLSLKEGVIHEHVHWMVALGNDGKPDAIWRKPCADKKTNGVCGDKWRIAKVKRLREQRTQFDKRKERGPKLKSNRKLENRGFDKSIRKRMDGTVVRNG